MHEHTFIQAIIKDVKNKNDVLGINLEVGDLAGIEPMHLMEHMKEETGWDVNVTKKDAKVKCSCGFEGAPKIRERLHDMVIFECPKCEQIPEVLEGDNIKITNIRYK